MLWLFLNLTKTLHVRVWPYISSAAPQAGMIRPTPEMKSHTFNDYVTHTRLGSFLIPTKTCRVVVLGCGCKRSAHTPNWRHITRPDMTSNTFNDYLVINSNTSYDCVPYPFTFICPKMALCPYKSLRAFDTAFYKFSVFPIDWLIKVKLNGWSLICTNKRNITIHLVCFVRKLVSLKKF